jgi:hypothetical protein
VLRGGCCPLCGALALPAALRGFGAAAARSGSSIGSGGPAGARWQLPALACLSRHQASLPLRRRSADQPQILMLLYVFSSHPLPLLRVRMSCRPPAPTWQLGRRRTGASAWPPRAAARLRGCGWRWRGSWASPSGGRTLCEPAVHAVLRSAVPCCAVSCCAVPCCDVCALRRPVAPRRATPAVPPLQPLPPRRFSAALSGHRSGCCPSKPAEGRRVLSYFPPNPSLTPIRTVSQHHPPP